MAIMVNSLKGLGDNIYQRAFIKNLGSCYIDTPWPELYEDLPAKIVQSRTMLRTQKKNISKLHSSTFSRFPGGKQLSIKYGQAGIINGMRDCFKIDHAIMDLPDFGESPVKGRYAVIRPVTVRKEWLASARNPEPKYLHEAVEELRAAGITIVSVADLEEGQEWIIGEETYADVKFHKGELDVKQLMAVINHAELVIGGIGWVVPACIAYKTPAWIICGGQGGYNHPYKITHESIDSSMINFAIPDNMCLCMQREHNCDKKIAGHRDKFRAYLATRDFNRVPSKGTDEL